MSPETIEVLTSIGQGLGFIGTILAGVYGGKRIERRRSNGNSRNYVPQTECKLRHDTETERWKNLLSNYDEMRKDIRSINEQMTLLNVNKGSGG